MKTVFVSLSVGLALLIPRSGAAQTTFQRTQVVDTGSQPVPAKQANAQQMYEDIEILRRLLNKRIVQQSCVRCHQSGIGGMEGFGIGNSGSGFGAMGMGEGGMFGGFAHHPDMAMSAGGAQQTAFPPGNGLHLAGQGVVYQTNLSPQWLQLQQLTSAPKGKKLSDWEKTRQQIYGKKTKAASFQVDAQHQTIEELILKVLADNGRHFSQLPANESITIAVSFAAKSNAQADPMAKVGGASGMPDEPVVYPGSGSLLPGEEGELPGPGSPYGESGLGPPGGALDPSGEFTPVKDYELLGDVLLKQGQVQKAMEAYEKALKRTTSSKRKVGLYRKLVTTCMKEAAEHEKRNKYGAHVRLVRQAMDFLKKLEEMKYLKSEDKKPASPLPSRLIISVTKRDLDQVGAGKMSFTEFQKLADVRWLHFRESDSKTSSSIEKESK